MHLALLMQIFIAVLVSLGLYGWYFIERPIFGELPKGKRLSRIEQSPNYKGGSFVNLEHTPDFAPGIGTWDAAKSFLNKPKNTEPDRDMPWVETNLKTIESNGVKLVWFGHSSYYLVADGLKILVDPVFSGNAAPVKLFGKSFKGTDRVDVSDFPEIDVLVITHDHYDHLDYETILKLKGKFKKIVTSLGVGAHLNEWGIPDEQMFELDWWESADLGNGFSLKAAPARHFSGRKFKRNQSIWSAFILNTPHHKLFLGGDSGYGKHFKEIGEKEGPFDLALLECGQYNAMWPYIHMTPEEVVAASQDLKAKVLMPVHWGKFALAMHTWNEPIQRLRLAAIEKHQKITTPLPGQLLELGKNEPDSIWWDF
jgi:L-ascorbate metabolism protein UlaG (beta-lactamase superfamily)